MSDVLLMYAEADNEINRGASAADTLAVNEVSKRAHGGNAALVAPIPTDYTASLNISSAKDTWNSATKVSGNMTSSAGNLLTTAIARQK